MGSNELLLVSIIALLYLAIPVITLIVVIQVNRRIAKIERDLSQVLKSK
jgi:hypothetical protein